MKSIGLSSPELARLFREIYSEQLKEEGKSERQREALVRARDLGLKVIEGGKP